jgi:hypothetical protein
MSKVSFDWNGDALIHRVEEASREAVNETVDAARDDAKATHTWKVDPEPRRLRKGGRLINPDLESQIVSEHDDTPGRNPTAYFGYTKKKGFYGLFHEEGTVHEHEYPALRPAADRKFPTLAARIKEKLR